MGSNDGEVEACFSCDSATNVRNGSSAGKDVEVE